MRIRAVAAALAAMGGATGALGAQAPVDAGRIDAVFAAYAGHDAPGCAVGVYREGRVAFARGYGMADLERRVPITPSTLFDLGSTSKQFAAAAIALLVAEGRLAYADDVRRHVPELPDYGTPITIDHLLRHTSGLRDYIGVMVLGGRRIDDASDDQEALDAIVRQRALNFPPGARWSYSNSGYFLLSVIVKRVTGRTLAEFAKERIFDPLGMARTHFRDDHTALLEGRALAYAPGAGGRLVHDMSNWDQTGDGAVWSSVEELVRWDRNFDDPQVGGAALLRDLQEPGRLADGSPIDYARGLTVDRYRGLPRVHHGG
jgi:CubicO group peptidase (beta-lactamase class C family)